LKELKKQKSLLKRQPRKLTLKQLKAQNNFKPKNLRIKWHTRKELVVPRTVENHTPKD